MKAEQEIEYGHGSIMAPLHLTALQERTLPDWLEFLMDVGDAAVLQRHHYYHIKNFRVDKKVPKQELNDKEKRWFLTYKDQQDEAKFLRVLYNEEWEGLGKIPAVLIQSELKNKDTAFKNFRKAIERQKAEKAEAKAKGLDYEWKYIEPPKPKAEILRKLPHRRRSMNFRGNLGSMQNSMERTANNPAYVSFRIPNLGIAKYRTDRDIPEDAVITEATISVKNGKWWVSFAYKFPKPEKPDLRVTKPEDVPDFTDLTNKQIVDSVDTSEVRAAGGDQGVINNWSMSDKTYRKKFNLNSAQQSRKYILRLRIKDYQRMLNHKRNIHGDDAPNYKAYQKIEKKLNATKEKLANIDDNRRHQTAAEIDKNYDIFVAEALTSQNMLEKMPNRDVTRRMAETGFGKMIDILQRKLGDRLILVDPRNTSRMDSFCGHVHKNNRYGERFRCKGCGRTANADYNASINIMAAGIVANPEYFRYKKMVSKSGPT